MGLVNPSVFGAFVAILRDDATFAIKSSTNCRLFYSLNILHQQRGRESCGAVHGDNDGEFVPHGGRGIVVLLKKTFYGNFLCLTADCSKNASYHSIALVTSKRVRTQKFMLNCKDFLVTREKVYHTKS